MSDDVSTVKHLERNMKITVEVPDTVRDAVNDYFNDLFDRDITDKEFEQFIINDLSWYFSEDFENARDLEAELESQFG
jgi:hypothetical protein